MCGISGIFLHERGLGATKFDYPAANTRMVEHQAKRGPDASGVWVKEPLLLGHTRLAIMDPTNRLSDQPIHTDRWALVYNGEIYNFRELRRELESRYSVVFRTESDTEVLLMLIDRWGVETAVNRLNGIYAFAAFDKLEKCLYLVRDRLGIKPLYLFMDADATWFASAPASIALAKGGSWELDTIALYKYFRLGAPMSEETLFRGISRVAPAELIRIDRFGRSTRWRYWQPTPSDTDLEEALHRAITGQREAHVRSAVFLSGGVDSSVMSLLLEDINFFHLESPETAYARYVAERLNRHLEVSRFQSQIEFDVLNDLYVRTAGEPSASAPIPAQIAQAISGAGYKVAFSANGADELFFGYPRTPAPELRPSHVPTNIYDAPPVFSETEQLEHIFRRADSYTMPVLHTSFEFAGRDWIDASLVPLGEGFPPSAYTRWFELQTYVQYDLNPTLDFASMAYSLEVRVPFLDHELIAAALSKDANVMITADYGRKTPLKRMLKHAGLNPLLWSRPKLGFSVPPQAMARRKRLLADSCAVIEGDGFLRVSGTCAPHSRDHQYLSAAAHAFLRWKRCWIDSGVVTI